MNRYYCETGEITAFHLLTDLELTGVGLRLTFSMIASTEITVPMSAHVPKAHQRFLGSKCQMTKDK